LWSLGSIVKLKEPYKPDWEDVSLSVSPSRYPEWKGYTHGIIVQHLGEWYGHLRVSLFLYDTSTHIHIEDEHNGIPTYVDFRTDELLLLKDGEVKGYTVEED
jgi:hypothetical protein